MLSVKNISKEFNNEKVLKDISLEIKENDFITIMGPSGGGKSTLLQIISLLTEPSEGEVWFGNSKVNFKKEKNINLIRRENISMIFQNANLISSLNVLENILITTNTNESYKDKVTRIKNLLDKVGLSKKYDSSVTSLSGGEAQRVSIARALINKPKLILCDEPTGALDSKNTKKIMQLLLNVQKENKTTLIIVTHDKEIGELGERKIFLKDGELYEVANNF
ncbi:MAG: ABC transporter ATP-binding protein [Sarcina sp.]